MAEGDVANSITSLTRSLTCLAREFTAAQFDVAGLTEALNKAKDTLHNEALRRLKVEKELAVLKVESSGTREKLADIIESSKSQEEKLSNELKQSQSRCDSLEDRLQQERDQLQQERQASGTSRDKYEAQIEALRLEISKEQELRVEQQKKHLGELDEERQRILSSFEKFFKSRVESIPRSPPTPISTGKRTASAHESTNRPVQSSPSKPTHKPTHKTSQRFSAPSSRRQSTKADDFHPVRVISQGPPQTTHFTLPSSEPKIKVEHEDAVESLQRARRALRPPQKRSYRESSEDEPEPEDVPRPARRAHRNEDDDAESSEDAINRFATMPSPRSPKQTSRGTGKTYRGTPAPSKKRALNPETPTYRGRM